MKQASKVSNRVKSRRFRAGKDNLDYKVGNGDSRWSDHGSVSILSDHLEDGNSSWSSTPRGDIPPSAFGVFAKIKDKFPGKPSRDYDVQTSE